VKFPAFFFMEAETKFTRGGRRPGSGRKPRDTQQITLRLSPATIARLKSRANELEMTMSELAEKKLKKV
jgi:hypothetical protein